MHFFRDRGEYRDIVEAPCVQIAWIILILDGLVFPLYEQVGVVHLGTKT